MQVQKGSLTEDSNSEHTWHGKIGGDFLYLLD